MASKFQLFPYSGTTLPVNDDDSDGSLAPSPPKRKKPSSATASSSGTESATSVSNIFFRHCVQN